MKKYLWLGICGVLFQATAFGQPHKVNKVIPVIKDQLSPTTAVYLDGLVNDKLNAAYENRILAQDIEQLINPFKHRNEDHLWQGEFWGKWFTSAVLAYRYHPTPTLKKKLDDAVNGLLTTQSTDGYIGNYAINSRLEQWDIWGRKYCMLGLLAYYDLNLDKKSLVAAAKVADHLMAELNAKGALIVEKGNYKGMPATSILEPITQLYVRTNHIKYLNFAESIVKQWELEQGPQLISRASLDVAKRFPYPDAGDWVSQGQKAYEMMSCYEGLLELYRITGNQIYRTAVEKTWENILATEISIIGSGSASECWYQGKSRQQHVALHSHETCVTATWIKLGLQLLRLSGDARYADEIEKSYYNGLLGAMKPDGSTWGMYSPLQGIRSEGSNQCEMGLNCCSVSGPRALFAFPLSIIMVNRTGIAVNFYNEGNYKVRTPAGQIATLVQTTKYPVNGSVKIQVQLKDEEEFSIAIRIPNWSKNNRLSINGNPVSNIAEGTYVPLKRKWKNGDEIDLELDMRTRIIQLDGSSDYLALQRGPVVLARDARMNNSVAIGETITPIADADGTVQTVLASGNNTNQVWMSFQIPCLVGSWRYGKDAEPINLSFCDYSSAGNTFSQTSYYEVWFPQLLDATGKGFIVK